jgi:hypothetical protein
MGQQARALETAASYIEQGYALLAQAQITLPGAKREARLSTAVEAFKKGYQYIGHTTQIQALLGATQSYLLMQTPHRVFPFLWQATPLQRAEKTLQQALVLQPENAAATLLLGWVYGRQAMASTPPQPQKLARSTTYLRHATALGIPVQLPTASASATAPPPRPFSLQDDVVFLRYIDIRGSGVPEDLVLIYRLAEVPGVCFGSVIMAGQAYPLISNPTTGVLLPSAAFETLTVVPREVGQPLLTVYGRQGALRLERRFEWDGNRFVSLATYE